MAVVIHGGGIGASSGDPIATGGTLASTGAVWFVSSVIGDDSNTGDSRLFPKATLGSAYASASAGDWIVLAAAHDETLTSAQTLAKAITILGEGTSGGEPTAQLRNNQASGSLLTVDTDDVRIIGVKFPTNVQANSAQLITCDNTRFYMRGCRFEMAENDNDSGLILQSGAGQVVIENTKFVSTATLEDAGSTDPPVTGLEVEAAMNDLYLSGVTFDGGSVGFVSAGLNIGAAVTRLRGESLSFLNGADYSVAASSTGYIHVGTLGGASSGTWA